MLYMAFSIWLYLSVSPKTASCLDWAVRQCLKSMIVDEDYSQEFEVKAGAH